MATKRVELGSLIAVLALAGAIFAGALWSASFEREASVTDFAQEQALLAKAVAIPFEERLSRTSSEGAGARGVRLSDVGIVKLLGETAQLEERGTLLILVSRPGESGFLTTDHRVIASARLEEAVRGGATSVVMPRDEALSFGLPARAAVGGVARVSANAAEPWGIVVLATAQRLRVRQEHERWRLGITVVIVSLVVGAFVRAVQKRQTRQIELERRVEVSQLAREYDAALAKADKMATLAALSTGIAHELGTPLGIIVGRVDQVASRVPSDEKVQANLTIVQEQVERIRKIVQGSLALARGDSPTLEPSSARACLERAAELVRHRFEQAGVRLQISIDPDVPKIACDASLFEQALVNLLLNACQATPAEGHVQAGVSVEDGHVTFSVEDEGPGISDERALRATEPFFSTKREQGGSGLGLTIVREIVSHHGGTFQLARREDRGGTRATIRIARASDDDR